MKTKKISINMKEYNEKILNLLESCREEKLYKMPNGFEYRKKEQTMAIEDADGYSYWENYFCNKKKEGVDEYIPFVVSERVYDNIFIPETYLNENINQIFQYLKGVNFAIIYEMIKQLHNNLKINGRNMSLFSRKMDEIFQASYASFWDVAENCGEDVLFYMLDLLLRSVSNIDLVVADEREIVELKKVRNLHILYSKEITYNNNGIKNLNQQLQRTFAKAEVPFGMGDQIEYKIWIVLIMDLRSRKVVLEKRVDTINLPLFLHRRTVQWLNERRHDIILNNVGVFLRTFDVFLRTKIKPEDRFRYLLAGSAIKALYNIRDCSDIDFFVLDHEDNIEKYGSYKPDIGIGNIYDDFGKTYYSNEEFYYPMIPELYELQQEEKRIRRGVAEEITTILNNKPKFSVSGLKAGRYVDIFSCLSKKMGYNIDNLDDLVFDPDCKIFVFGCPIICLKLELLRDNMKDIDLGRISRKQMYDMFFIRDKMSHLFDEIDFSILGFSRLNEKRCNRSLINLSEINCYNMPLVEGSASYDLVFRRYPLYFEGIMRRIIDEGPLLISSDNRINEADILRRYQRPMLSTLRQKLEMRGEPEDVIYYYEISDKGEITIEINEEEGSIYENICITGFMKVEENASKKIFLNVKGKKMNKIYQKLETLDKKKEYRMMCVNMMKNIVQLHKMMDNHTKERILVDKF